MQLPIKNPCSSEESNQYRFLCASSIYWDKDCEMFAAAPLGISFGRKLEQRPDMMHISRCYSNITISYLERSQPSPKVETCPLFGKQYSSLHPLELQYITPASPFGLCLEMFSP